MRQTLLSIILIVLILATGFIWFRYIRVSPEAGQPAGEETISERLNQYRQLKNLKPDISIFQDPLFRLLERPAPPSAGPATPSGPSVPIGRSNPFVPTLEAK